MSPILAALFVVSFAGIAFVLRSRDVGRKRIVFPLTFLAFSIGFYIAARESPMFAEMPSFVLPLLLVANAAWVSRSITSCESCRRTMQVSFGKAGPHFCPRCAKTAGDSLR